MLPKRGRSAGWAAAFIVTLAAAGCGDGSSQRRASVDTYFRAVNRLELRTEPATRAANAALRRLNIEGPTPEQNRRLRAAATALDTAGDALRRLEPPSEAAQIHRDLVRLYALQATLVREVGTLVRFLPIAQRTLKSVRQATPAAHVTAAGLARYADRLRMTAATLEALTPPAALKPWRNEQIRQLRRRAQEIRRMAAAVRAHDLAATRILLVRYRRLITNASGISAAQRHALLSYNARIAKVAKLRDQIAREQAALNRSLH